MKRLVFALGILSLVGCGEAASQSSQAAPQSNQAYYQPTAGTSWQLQLLVDDDHPLNTTYDATVYDIDLYDNSAATIQGLQAAGKKVICYFSAGSYEDWRDDAGDFKAAELGNDLDGWEGERWLDIRSANVHAIMKKRIAFAKDKGCDGVDPDNVDGYTNDPGFDFTAADQLAYNRFLAAEAHANGLSIGLKNDLDQVVQLVDDFDFSVNEQCFQYDECEMLSPFIKQNKPVFNVEYATRYRQVSGQTTLCQDAKKLGLSSVVLALNLDDSYRFSCQ